MQQGDEHGPPKESAAGQSVELLRLTVAEPIAALGNSGIAMIVWCRSEEAWFLG
jgi:hypothetical protein